MTIAQVEDALTSVGDMSTLELAGFLEISDTAVHGAIRHLRKHGKVHIVRWERTNGRGRPVYRAGAGTDAVEPRRLTNVQYHARYRAHGKFIKSLEPNIWRGL